MMQFEKPEVNSTVKVCTDYRKSLPAIFHGKSGIFERTGRVLASEKFDSAESFRMETGNKTFPVSVVHLSVVSKLEYIDGKKLGKTKIISGPAVKTFIVKSNTQKNKSYTVTKTGDKYTCTCPASIYRTHQQCSHVKSVMK